MEFVKLIASIPFFALILFVFFQSGQGFYLHSVFTDAVAMAGRLAVTHGRQGLIQNFQGSLFDNILRLQNQLIVVSDQGGFTFNQNFNGGISDTQLGIFSGFVSNPRERFQQGAGVYNELHQNLPLQMTHILAIFLANRSIASAIPYLQYPCLENDSACFTCFIRAPVGCNLNQGGFYRDYFTIVCEPRNLGVFFQFIAQTLQNRPGGYSATFVRPLGLP